MDTRTLIAFGMLLAVLTVALIKGTLDGAAAKEVLMNIASGLIGGAVGGAAVARQFRLQQAATPPGQTPPRGTPTLPLLLLLAGAALMFAGCATTEPYVGPVGPPTITGDEWMFPHGIDGRWTRETTLHINNSQPTQLDAVLDCDTQARHARKWPGSRFTLHVPPMTVQHVLIDPHDHVCSLLPVVPDDAR